MSNNNPFLPGFEFLKDDEAKHKKDKELKREILEATREYTSLKNSYSSPYKLITVEDRLRKAIEARNALWNIRENEGG